MKKTMLASAVGLAISGTAHAGIEQIRAAHGQSVHEIYANQVAVSLDEQTEQPSAWLILLNAPASSDALQGDVFNQQLAAQNVANAETLQREVSYQLRTLDADAEVLLQTKHLAAGLVVTASAQALEALQQSAAVRKILPIYDSKPMVADSAEYIRAVQTVESGKATGEGIKVAILDSGVDYTHAALGGPGTAEAYAAALSDQTSTPAWPIGQVIGGYDFLRNDPNPIDDVRLAGSGHGTSVAHSVAGIAPRVAFYAYTVCTNTCPGVAQLRALEAAMDPNGDGNLEDRVDIINMSLGGQFGSTQTMSGTQFLIQRAVKLGTNMVISAGNDGNVPFRVGGPSTTPNALSVGAMTHPAAAVGVFEEATIDGETTVMVAAGFNRTLDLDFSSATTPLVLIPGEYTACEALAEDVDLTGKAVLVSRGVCAFVEKVKVAQQRGAAFVIISNSNPGEPPIVAGGDDPTVTIPAVMITKEVGDKIKAKLEAGEAVSYEIRSVGKSGAGAIANFTSRGPAIDGLLKPEITAPGVSIDVARVGTGTGQALVNGTSFSGPITAGAVALVRGALPERSALEVKATLMNTANLTVHREPIEINPNAKLASISQIGAGLVDVEKAVNSPVAAWVNEPKFDTGQAALSFGLQSVSEVSSMTKTVTLKNFSNSNKTYNLRVQDRYTDKTATGALSWNFPASVTVPANQTVQFDVTLTVDPAKLPDFVLTNGVYWAPLNAATQMDAVEFDGALVFNDPSTSSDHDLHLVYHLIPKAVGQLQLSGEMVNGQVATKVNNVGAIPVAPFASTLVATSAANPEINPIHDIRAVTFDIAEADFCASGYALYPTIHLAEGVTHLLQGNYAIDIDVNNDGVYNHTMNTLLLTRLGTAYAGSPGVMVSFNTPYNTTSGFFGDVLHFSGSKQITLEACFNHVGLTAADVDFENPRSITARFRTNPDSNSLTYSQALTADQVTASVTLLPSPAVTMVSSLDAAEGPAEMAESDNTVTELAPGESAYLQRPAGDNRSFVLLSAQAEAAAVANYAAPLAQPVVNTTSGFSVDENTAAGTVIGQLTATTDFRTAATEFVVLGSSTSAIRIESDGRVVVAPGATLNYEAGMTGASFEVAVLDSSGQVSAPVTVNVIVNNLPDEAPVLTSTVTMSSLASGTAAGTVVGSVTVQVREADATLAGVTSSNPLFAVQNGQIILTRSPSKADAGNQSFTLTARDSAGLQATATGQVNVTHKSSGGSAGWLGLLLLPLLWLRSRTKA
jgi:hypothetical protein